MAKYRYYYDRERDGTDECTGVFNSKIKADIWSRKHKPFFTDVLKRKLIRRKIEEK